VTDGNAFSIAIIVIGLGVLIGLLGSLIGLRRFLRV
jgi:cell division protein FtsX